MANTAPTVMIKGMNTDIAQLAAYIQNQMQQGRLEGVIRNELAQKGWSEQAIDDAFQLIWQQANSQMFAPTPAETAPAAPMPSKKKRIMIVIAIVVGAPLLFFVVVMMLSSASLQQSAQETQRQVDNAAAEQQKADDARREQDVTAVVSAVGDYMEQNNGLYPRTTGPGAEQQVLYICGDSCETGAKTDVKLDIYKPSDISVKTYSSGLAKPQLKEVFIVANAVCNDKKDGVAAPKTTDDPLLSIAFLYAMGSTDKPTVHCQPL